ncbi:S1/P1 nuclease [Elizabethkingia sp. JS20170427COW]|uniref:S1/P1 nuclease n=1 Tax=Elizabethkingia sp. JS20170427COW TaxID=2583851 RepID=UPI001110BD3D|nr:S1/P1 nuclease [Elizabethkingia sp. JS20170427COW]QCX54272.1 S1/P1 nuclease [Elizabethkingia sp. JS20170427COW]
MIKLASKLMICLMALSFTQAFAWGLTGHRVIAQIAENHLSNKAKREIKKIFGKEELAYWANWPDFIKSDTTGVWKPTNVWHYVNIDPQPDFESFKKNLEAQAGPSMYTQIKVLSTQIKNKQTNAKDRKIAMIFLVHIMGDMAQPMHTGRSGDLGGNKIKVTYFGKNINLHSLWDSHMIESLGYSYTELAHLLDIKTKDEVKKIQEGTVLDWVYESHQLANNIYANTPDGSKVSYDYGYKYDRILEDQLLKGGLRLAKVINDLF